MNSKGTPKNLLPAWRKGQPSPNPSGRPHRLPISDTYARIADEPLPESMRKTLKRKGVILEPGATCAEALVKGVLASAIGGDLAAAKEFREASEGKIGQRVSPPEEPEEPQQVIVQLVHIGGGP
jgi:hypothetical protein